jgi:hypothetical protein
MNPQLNNPVLHDQTVARPNSVFHVEPKAPMKRDGLQFKSSRNARLLKIEEEGDRWTGTPKPKIRLTGRWLEKAGFPAGNQVQVIPIAAGVLELRFTHSNQAIS